MVTSSPSASQGHHGVMATVWLVLIAMFLGILSALDTVAVPEEAPASPLDVLSVQVTVGETPRTSAPIPVEFFEEGSAALTEPGRDWLLLFADRAPDLRPDQRLRLEIIPPSDAPDLTAARIATVTSLFLALGVDMSRIELGSRRSAGAMLRLAGGRR